ncbi:spore germination protein [Aneurinibacillus aneurinilyticus]|nr:spore germination protein [Aneurinibacillus aneurinilyticus]MED0708824.1 spore germination protein [Aneurinibacillus aneurinilyticus]MED0722852.1 spore germination protein [Aneurinibacillus aneurinilyticus]MED0742891.1 spore germination protein [Aneurinibacillus aneurinilyticus]
MSSVIGCINIGTMDNGSTIIAKRTALISPKAVSTSNSGSGAANTANFMRNFNAVNSTNTERPHVADQNIASAV